MKIILQTMSPASTIIFTILALAVVVVLSYFLFKSIKKTYLQEKEEKQFKIEGVISKSEMSSLIATYINRSRGSANFSLIYIDLDKFNDFTLAFGKKEAKNIIKNVVLKIKALLPELTYVSRYQQDDFLIFLPNKYSRTNVYEIAGDMLDSFRQKTKVSGDALIDLTATIAIAYYPTHGDNIKALLESLEVAIFKGKRIGGNNLQVYSKTSEEETEEMDYYYQIKKAINNKEFILYYQPMIDVLNKKVYGYEALLRWEHPELGVLSPNKFINVMEGTGDIHWVGEWGFETLVQKHLELESLNQKDIMLSINLSPKQIMDKEIVNRYNKILRRYRVDAKNFLLELGEFTLFDKNEAVIENILSLKKLGFMIAIDGFGIDITSFDKLDKLDVDVLKIDYKFISEDSFSVNKYLEVLTEYITKKHKDLICQGIESIDEELRAKAFNFTKMQGYYYSKPIDSTKINDFKYSDLGE